MKTLIALLILCPSFAHAEWCDIKDKKTGVLINTYEGACAPSKYFDGQWGDPKNTVHEPNVARDDKSKAEKKKEKDRKERKERIETQCARAEGLLKEMCDHLLDK